MVSTTLFPSWTIEGTSALRKGGGLVTPIEARKNLHRPSNSWIRQGGPRIEGGSGKGVKRKGAGEVSAIPSNLPQYSDEGIHHAGKRGSIP